jgi:hypothetical protein
MHSREDKMSQVVVYFFEYLQNLTPNQKKYQVVHIDNLNFFQYSVVKNSFITNVPMGAKPISPGSLLVIFAPKSPELTFKLTQELTINVDQGSPTFSAANITKNPKEISDLIKKLIAACDQELKASFVLVTI